MNEDGHPPTLRAAQPGNRNAVKGGVYSARVRAARADEIRAAATGTSTLALTRAAIRDEVALLERVREALDEDIAARGPSTRAGAPRGQVSQRSSVSRQLAKLELTWAMGEFEEGDDNVDRGSEDGAGSLREELLALLALRHLLDHDLVQRGVSTPRGGERRQVALRVQASRDLVRLADRIRIQARRAVRRCVAPMSSWDVAREIAFDASQYPSDVLAAVKHLLTHRPPRVKSPEQEAFEEEVAAWSDADIEAELRELEAAANEARAASGPDADTAADTEDEPGPSEAPGSEVITRCLEVLQRISDGFDSRASGRDRMRAVELREQYLAATSPRDAIRDAFEEEIDSWTPQRLKEELESLLAEEDD